MIGVVALVVIGPERLPDVARKAGRWVAKIQRFVRGVRSDISRELESGELKSLIGDQREQIKELRELVDTAQGDLRSSSADIVRGTKESLKELESSFVDTEADTSSAATENPVPTKPAGGGVSVVQSDGERSPAPVGVNTKIDSMSKSESFVDNSPEASTPKTG